jgi:hypothetical protein
VFGLRRFLIDVDKSPQLLVRHAIELASAARLDLFDVEAPSSPRKRSALMEALIWLRLAALSRSSRNFSMCSSTVRPAAGRHIQSRVQGPLHSWPSTRHSWSTFLSVSFPKR